MLPIYPGRFGCPAAMGGFVGALDAHTSNLTWAGGVKRKLIGSYSGALFRARSSAVGSPEQDIGASGAGLVDSAALTTFAGSSSAYARTIYNQCGSGLADWVQTTASCQPRLINAGTAEDEGGMYFDGSDDCLDLSLPSILDLLGTNTGHIWLRVKTGNPPNNGRLFDVTGATTGFWCPFSGSVYWDYASTSAGRITTTTPSGVVGSWADISIEKDGSNSRIRVNGTQVAAGATSATLSAAAVTARIGNLVAGGGVWKGWLKELAVWKDGTQANCAARIAALAA